MVNCASSGNGDARAAISSERIRQSFHQNLMGAQEVSLAAGVPFPVVGPDGVADFLNVLKRSGDGFAVENCCDLLLADNVALDGQLTANCASPAKCLQLANRFADLFDT